LAIESASAGGSLHVFAHGPVEFGYFLVVLGSLRLSASMFVECLFYLCPVC